MFSWKISLFLENLKKEIFLEENNKCLQFLRQWLFLKLCSKVCVSARNSMSDRKNVKEKPAPRKLRTEGLSGRKENIFCILTWLQSLLLLYIAVKFVWVHTGVPVWSNHIWQKRFFFFGFYFFGIFIKCSVSKGLHIKM